MAGLYWWREQDLLRRVCQCYKGLEHFGRYPRRSTFRTFPCFYRLRYWRSSVQWFSSQPTSCIPHSTFRYICTYCSLHSIEPDKHQANWHCWTTHQKSLWKNGALYWNLPSMDWFNRQVWTVDSIRIHHVGFRKDASLVTNGLGILWKQIFHVSSP